MDTRGLDTLVARPAQGGSKDQQRRQKTDPTQMYISCPICRYSGVIIIAQPEVIAF